jgi:alpha-tubulin suppressor-like RCC1 family protein
VLNYIAENRIVDGVTYPVYGLRLDGMAAMDYETNVQYIIHSAPLQSIALSLPSSRYLRVRMQVTVNPLANSGYEEYYSNYHDYGGYSGEVINLEATRLDITEIGITYNNPICVTPSPKITTLFDVNHEGSGPYSNRLSIFKDTENLLHFRVYEHTELNKQSILKPVTSGVSSVFIPTDGCKSYYEVVVNLEKLDFDSMWGNKTRQYIAMSWKLDDGTQTCAQKNSELHAFINGREIETQPSDGQNLQDWINNRTSWARRGVLCPDGTLVESDLLNLSKANGLSDVVREDFKIERDRFNIVTLCDTPKYDTAALSVWFNGWREDTTRQWEQTKGPVENISYSGNRLMLTPIDNNRLWPCGFVGSSSSGGEAGGTVLAWGEHSGGAELSSITSTSSNVHEAGSMETMTIGGSNVPVPVSGFTGIMAIAGGGAHSLALKNDGTVWAWGYNGDGELGNGTNTDSNVPVQVSFPDGTVITAIAGGGSHSLALKSDGTVWVWGYNNEGQLGNGTNTSSNVPVQVSNLTGITAIAGGGAHSLALKNDGTVWAWGYNGDGELGNGTTTDSNVPVQVSNLTGITAIAGGDSHSIILKNDGTVWAWGGNEYGQLGNGTNTDSNVPVQVSFPDGTVITAIAGGGDHSLALKNDGTVWVWGHNNEGQLGNGTNTSSNVPVQVSNLTGITAIAGGGNHSLALKNDGTVWAWGANWYGELGNGTNTSSNVPVQVSNLTGITAIAGGSDYSIALQITTEPSVVNMYTSKVYDSTIPGLEWTKVTVRVSTASLQRQKYILRPPGGCGLASDGCVSEYCDDGYAGHGAGILTSLFKVMYRVADTSDQLALASWIELSLTNSITSDADGYAYDYDIGAYVSKCDWTIDYEAALSNAIGRFIQYRIEMLTDGKDSPVIFSIDFDSVKTLINSDIDLSLSGRDLTISPV